MSYPFTPTIFSIIRGPVRVPETEYSRPSLTAPRSVVTLRMSSSSESVVRVTPMPRCSARTGALT